MNVSESTEKLANTIREAAIITGLSVSTLYIKIESGELPARKLGRRTIVLRRDPENFLEALPVKSEPSVAHRQYVRRRWDAAKQSGSVGVAK